MNKNTKNLDFIFECCKCGHNLYVAKSIKAVRSLLVYDCDCCGEEPCWKLIGEGEFNKKIA